MSTLQSYANRYRKPNAAAAAVAQPGHRQHQENESVQEFIAFLYSVIRDDPGMVQVIDRALKARYGYNENNRP